MSVVIVSAETGCTGSAKPATSEIMTNPRRVHCVRSENPSNPISDPSMMLLPIDTGYFLRSALLGKGRSPKIGRSVIVIVIKADAGAAGLTGLAADRQMRPHLNLDGHFAGWRRDTLADPD